MGAEHIDNYELFTRYRQTGDRALRNRIVEKYGGLVEFTLQRFRNHSADREDLRQVAYLGMVTAADRFDPERGVQFSTFASRSMEGEIKRYLRDRTWSVRPPRRSQELHLELRNAEDRLVQRLARAPLVSELAEELGVSEDDVLLAVEARQAHRATSIDGSIQQRGRFTADVDDRHEDFDRVEVVDAVRRLLDRLPSRERELLTLRYMEGMSQPQMAERLGVSQSYLSRMLRRTISKAQQGQTARDSAVR